MTAIRALLFGGIVCWLLALESPGHASGTQFSLRLETSGIAAADLEPVRTFVEAVEKILPPRVKAKIKRSIVLSFAQLDEQTAVDIPSCEPAALAPARSLKPPQRLGKALFLPEASAPAAITLHRGLLPVLVQGPEQALTYACGHRSLYRLAQATLIHEIFHIYDQIELVSTGSLYQNLHRFERQGILRAIQTRNILQMRSPDPYEFSNIRENFAVNSEYYLLDPEYKCRKPAVYRFLENEFGYRPFHDFRCAIGVTVYAGDRPVRLDPDRVYQIHYLWATRGRAMESRWGHAMFRLILCAPERKQVDEKCLQDIQHHVVISFVANLGGDLQISAWKGLTGGYLSQLFFRTMSDVIIEYTELEFRDLHSYPMILSETEKQQFIHHALEMYWGYAGRYYFFTNNCAVESASLLKSSVNSPLAQSLKILTPADLLRELLGRKLAAPIDLTSAAAAEEKGFLFRSLYDVFTGEFAAIAQTLPKGAPTTLKRWLSSTSSQQRRAWFDGAAGRSSKLFAAHFFALEGLIMNLKRKELEGKLVRLYYRSRTPQKYEPLQRTLQALRQALQRNMPWEWMRGGYGVPLARELVSVSAPAIEKLFGALEQEAMKVLRIELPAEYAETLQIQENRRVLMARVLAEP